MDQELSVFEDQGKVERAKKRGKAWQCLHCHNNSQKRWIDIKCRVEDHIMKYHLALEEVPFYCKLCWFRYQRQDQLVGHVTKYKRHIELATQGQVIDHSQYLIRNAQPHVIGPLDYAPLTSEESLKHFLGIRQDSQDSVTQIQKETAVTQMTEGQQTECLKAIQAAPGQTSVMQGAQAVTYQSVESAQLPMVHLPSGTFSQDVNLAANFLNEGQVASAQLSQMLSSILNNQQLLLASYHASLTAGLPSLSSQEVATAMATIEESNELPSTNVTVAEDLGDVIKASPEDERSVVSEASTLKDDESVEIEDSLDADNEPEAIMSQKAGSHQKVQKSLVLEMSPPSIISKVLNGQPLIPSQISADSQSDTAQESQSRSVPLRAQTPDTIQPLNLSVKEDCVDKLIPKQVSVESEKRNTVEKNQLESDQPLDLRIVKAAETTIISKIPAVMSGDRELEEGPRQEEQSTSVAGEDEKGETDNDVETTDDRRNVVVTTHVDEYVPVYVPTPVSKLKAMYARKDVTEETERDEAREENVLGEILQEEDMTLSSPLKRRTMSEGATTGKKRKTEEIIPELQVDVTELSERTLVTVVDTFRKVMQQNVAELREMRKAVIDSTVVMSKLVDGLARHKSALEIREKEEQKKMERRVDFERRWEEERRREEKRQKEDDRRRDDRKREMGRREREINQRERELDQREREGQKRRYEKSAEESSKSKSKENEPTLKSVLGESRNKSGGFKGRRW